MSRPIGGQGKAVSKTCGAAAKLLDCVKSAEALTLFDVSLDGEPIKRQNR